MSPCRSRRILPCPSNCNRVSKQQFTLRPRLFLQIRLRELSFETTQWRRIQGGQEFPSPYRVIQPRPPLAASKRRNTLRQVTQTRATKKPCACTGHTGSAARGSRHRRPRPPACVDRNHGQRVAVGPRIADNDRGGNGRDRRSLHNTVGSSRRMGVGSAWAAFPGGVETPDCV